jgi:hypothetical protein
VGAVFGVMALAQTQLSQYGVIYVIIYGMTFLFNNFGPNATTFIIPVEVRGFAHVKRSADLAWGPCLDTHLASTSCDFVRLQLTEASDTR